MRSQKTEVDSLQLQLAQLAQKVRSSVERELRESFQPVKDECDQLRDLVKSLECSVSDRSQKLAAVSEELRQERQDLQLAYANTEELKLELNKKNILVSQESDKVTVLERQLETKSLHCNDLEREINHMKRKLEEQTRPKKVVATQTLQDIDIAERDNRIACLEDKLAETEQRIKDAKDQLLRTAKERDALRGQLNDVTENSAAMQLKLDSSLSTTSNLEFNLKQSTDKISRLESTISEKEKRNQTVEHAANEMKVAVSSLTAENAVLKQRIKDQSDDEKLKLLVSTLEQKNSELTAQVGILTKELQAKPRNDPEILLQKDEIIAQLQLELDAERQRHKDEAECSFRKQKSSVGEADKSSVGLDRLKKRYETELCDSESRCSELSSKVDSLKRELQAAEISRQQELSKLEEKVADLTLKLSSAERRACRMEQKKISASSQTTERDVQPSEDRPVNILSLMQTPIENEQTGDGALVPKVSLSSDTVDNASDLRRQLGSDSQQLITALQSRVRDLEQELEKSNSGKLKDGNDGKVVSMFVVIY